MTDQQIVTTIAGAVVAGIFSLGWILYLVADKSFNATYPEDKRAQQIKAKVRRSEQWKGIRGYFKTTPVIVNAFLFLFIIGWLWFVVAVVTKIGRFVFNV